MFLCPQASWSFDFLSTNTYFLTQSSIFSFLNITNCHQHWTRGRAGPAAATWRTWDINSVSSSGSYLGLGKQVCSQTGRWWRRYTAGRTPRSCDPLSSRRPPHSRTHHRPGSQTRTEGITTTRALMLTAGRQQQSVWTTAELHFPEAPVFVNTQAVIEMQNSLRSNVWLTPHLFYS